MRFQSILTEHSIEFPVRIGNVYPIKGGRGVRERHLQVLIAMSEPAEYNGITCFFLVLNREGSPVNVNRYAFHYVQDLMPIGFVHGIDEVTFEITSL